MADLYGVRITPDDGGKPVILDGSMRYASFLGSASLQSNASSVAMKPQPVGSRALIVPRSLVQVYPSFNPAGPIICFITAMSFSGAALSFTAKYRRPDGTANPQRTAGLVDVFSVSGAADPAAMYGVRITNGSDFMEITDTSYLGFVTWRGIITVSGSWAIPAEIVALGNYIVFARWNNTETPLFLDRDSSAIRTFTGFGNTGGSVQGGVVTDIQVVIVSCGFSPDLPASGYGMVIRNAANQITYSSKYPPVMWPDAFYSFASYETYDDTTGEVLSWVDPAGNVAQPMVPLCSLGLQRGDYTRNPGNGWRYRIALYAGMKMSGNRVSTARAKSTGNEVVVTQYPKAVQVACQLPCIEASYYF